MKRILSVIGILMILAFWAKVAGNATGCSDEVKQNIVIALLTGAVIITFAENLKGVLGLYTNVSVTKPGTNKGTGGDKKTDVVMFDWDEVASGYDRDAAGIVITGPLVMKAGKYMIEVYGTIDKLEGGAKSEGDIDNKGVKQSYKLSHPGDEQAILEFRANWLNKNIGIIDRKCSSAKKLMYGSPCAPLQLAFDYKNNNSANITEFTIESALKGPDIAIYEGTLTLDTVTDTVAADATSIDLTNGEGQYQLTTGSVAAVVITTCTDAVNGLVFTLLGSGGTYPSTITAANDFLLTNGTTWTANAGSKITFKAFKNGASTYKYFEQSRS